MPNRRSVLSALLGLPAAILCFFRKKAVAVEATPSPRNPGRLVKKPITPPPDHASAYRNVQWSINIAGTGKAEYVCPVHGDVGNRTFSLLFERKDGNQCTLVCIDCLAEMIRSHCCHL